MKDICVSNCNYSRQDEEVQFLKGNPALEKTLNHDLLLAMVEGSAKLVCLINQPEVPTDKLAVLSPGRSELSLPTWITLILAGLLWSIFPWASSVLKKTPFCWLLLVLLGKWDRKGPSITMAAQPENHLLMEKGQWRVSRRSYLLGLLPQEPYQSQPSGQVPCFCSVRYAPSRSVLRQLWGRLGSSAG